jgi:hypothetical protein
MTTAQEFLDREAASWEAFDAQVQRVGVDRREMPGVVEGWSLKDVVWHCAYWARFAADHLTMQGPGGQFTDPFEAQPDEYWDGVNAEIAQASAAMSWDDVAAGTQEARASIRAVVAEPGFTAEQIAWAGEESWVHYDEHAEHVEAYADRSAV